MSESKDKRDDLKLSFFLACMSDDVLGEIYKLYDDLYGKCSNKSLRDKEIVILLSEIVDESFNCDTWNLIYDLSPERKNTFGVEKNDPYMKHCMLVLIQKIKLSENLRLRS
tara:strand:- start:1583 stop:1915 length:333 start_codon:yes stop_codon:yes gene_type:complete